MTVQNLKLKVLANFPTAVQGAGGVDVSKVNGVWTVQPKFENVALITSASVTGTKEVLARDELDGTYSRVTLQAIVDALGQTAGAIAITYIYDSATADADPGPGKLRLNNAAAQNAATTAFVEVLDAGSNDWTSVLDTFDASTSTIKGTIRLTKLGNSTKWLTFNVTARATAVGYRKFTIQNTGSSSAAPFVNGDTILLVFSRTGDAGSGLRHGQCRLSLSAGNLVLKPMNGNALVVNGAMCTVPDAGVSLAPTGLVVGTNYYIYATASGGVINALEASTTTHATSTTPGNNGVEIKSGDDTRSLVGMARVVTGPAWADSATQRFVRSWFNDPGAALTGANINLASTTSTTLIDLNSSAHVEWLNWANEPVHVTFSGSFRNSVTSSWISSQIGIDSTTSASGTDASSFTPSGGLMQPFSATYSSSGLAESYHFAAPCGAVSANTGTWTTIFGACALTGSLGGRR